MNQSLSLMTLVASTGLLPNYPRGNLSWIASSDA
jgi:hypothetical protein